MVPTSPWYLGWDSNPRSVLCKSTVLAARRPRQVPYFIGETLYPQIRFEWSERLRMATSWESRESNPRLKDFNLALYQLSYIPILLTTVQTGRNSNPNPLSALLGPGASIPSTFLILGADSLRLGRTFSSTKPVILLPIRVRPLSRGQCRNRTGFACFADTIRKTILPLPKVRREGFEPP